MCFKCFRILDTLSFLSLSPSSSWVTASSYSHDFESCAGEILPLLNVNALTVVAGELAWFEIVCLSKSLIWYLGKDILPFYTLTPLLPSSHFNDLVILYDQPAEHVVSLIGFTLEDPTTVLHLSSRTPEKSTSCTPG